MRLQIRPGCLRFTCPFVPRPAGWTSPLMTWRPCGAALRYAPAAQLLLLPQLPLMPPLSLSPGCHRLLPCLSAWAALHITTSIWLLVILLVTAVSMLAVSLFMQADSSSAVDAKLQAMQARGRGIKALRLPSSLCDCTHAYAQHSRLPRWLQPLERSVSTLPD